MNLSKACSELLEAAKDQPRPTDALKRGIAIVEHALNSVRYRAVKRGEAPSTKICRGWVKCPECSEPNHARRRFCTNCTYDLTKRFREAEDVNPSVSLVHSMGNVSYGQVRTGRNSINNHPVVHSTVGHDLRLTKSGT